MSTLYRADIRTELGEGTLRIDDTQGNPESINGEVYLPFTIHHGDSQSGVDPFETASSGSYIDFKLDDPTGELFDRFERFFDETRYDVVLDLPAYGVWRGKVRNDLVKGPTSRSQKRRTVNITVYDRLGQLQDEPAPDSPQYGSFLRVLTQCFWTANAEIPIFVGIDAEFRKLGGSWFDVLDIAPYSREPTGYDQNTTKEPSGDPFDFNFDSLREVLDELAKGLTCKAFYDPVSEHWLFIHRSAIGSSISGYRTNANGIGNATWSSHTLANNEVNTTRSDIAFGQEDVKPVRPLDSYILKPRNPRAVFWGEDSEFTKERNDLPPQTGGFNKDPFCIWSKIGSSEPYFWEIESGSGKSVIDSPSADKPTGIKLPKDSSDEDTLNNKVKIVTDSTDTFFRTVIKTEEYNSGSNVEWKWIANYQDGTQDVNPTGWASATFGVDDNFLTDGKTLSTIELKVRGYSYYVFAYFAVLRTKKDLFDKPFRDTFKDSYKRVRRSPVRRNEKDATVNFLINDGGSFFPPDKVRSNRLSEEYERLPFYRYHDRVNLESENLYSTTANIFSKAITPSESVKLDIPQKKGQSRFVQASGREVSIGEGGEVVTRLQDVEQPK